MTGGHHSDRRYGWFAAMLLLCFAALTSVAMGGEIGHARLDGADAQAEDNYGFSVAIDGDTAVVGAFLADVGDDVNEGAVYVFVRGAEGWAQQAKLVAADGGQGYLFGRSVAIDGDTIAVGAVGADAAAAGDRHGAAYVFTRSGASWTEQAKLIAADGALGDELGASVAVAGDTVLAGAHSHHVGSNNVQGAAYVFVRSGGSWTQQQKLLASDGASFAAFGNAVALSGDTAVIGAHQSSPGGGFWHGSAYVFVRSGATWTEQAKLVHDDAAIFDQFGHAVDVDGDTALVSTRLSNDGRGAVYAFVRSGASWTQQAKLAAGDAAANDWFGSGVALAGDTAVIGAAQQGSTVGLDLDRGAAYVFTRSGTVWSEQDKLVAGDGAQGDFLGTAVALDGERILAGAPGADGGGGVDRGTAYVFGPGESGPLPPQIALEPANVSASLPAGGSGEEALVVGNGGEQALEWTLVEDAHQAGGVRRPVRATTAIETTADVGAVARERMIGSGAAARRVETTPPAPVGDALTITHSATTAIIDGHTIACADNQTGFTTENRYLRTFMLADFGIGGGFDVSEVMFGVERLTPGANVTVNLYTLDGPLLFVNLTLLASQTVPLAEQEATLVTVPIAASVPAGATLVMEVVPPDMSTLGGRFYLGSNDDGETAPSYIAAPGCEAHNPVSYASIGFPNVHLVMSVTGTPSTATDCARPAWLSATPSEGTVAAGESQPVTLGFDAAGLANGNHVANLCFASNDPVQPLAVVPVELTVGGGDPTPSQLVSGDGLPDDWFGRAVSIDGDTALVGADAADIGGISNAGAAYVFVRAGSGWVEQAKLTASDGAQFNQFGISVALSGDTALIGGGSGTNGAYVFVRDGTTWTQQTKLTAGDMTPEDDFGIAVSIDGDTALVGARQADVAGNMNQGAAYVFVRSGAAWTEQAKLTAADGAPFDVFGDSVSIRGDTVIAGAAFADPGGNDGQGAAYVFTRSGTAWSQQAKLVASDGASGAWFGTAVAVSGDAAVVGASLAGGNQGAAYVFERSGTSWSEQARLMPSDAPANALFGDAVAIDGATAIVGALFADGQGAAYVFDRGSSGWTERRKLIAPDAAPNDQFGNDVAISGSTALIGAWQKTIEGHGGRGAAYVFELDGGGAGPLAIAPDSVDFGSVPAGVTAGPATVTVTNTGDTAVNVTAIDAPAMPFARTGGDCPAAPFELAPDASCTLAYVFQPITTGPFEQTLSVASAAGSATLTLRGTGIAVLPAQLVLLGGSGQSATVGSAFAQPLAVQVRDNFNNPVPGIGVSFVPPGSGPSAVLSASTVVTDANGFASVTATANGEAGSYQVMAFGGLGAPVAFALSNAAASADLAVTMQAARPYVRPGQVLDYVVGVHNLGPDAGTGVNVASVLSPLLDLGATTWQCLTPGSGCVASGSGNLAETGLSVPVQGMVLYAVRTAVPPGAPDGIVESAADVVAPGDPNAANDHVVAATSMVLFRDGFQPYGNGAAALPLEPVAEPLTTAQAMSLTWPDAGDALIETLLVAESPHGGFRLERLGVAPTDWARLVTVAIDGVEHAGAWLPVVSGTELTIALLDVEPAEGEGERIRSVLLFGPGIDARLPLPASTTDYRLRATVPVRAQAIERE